MIDKESEWLGIKILELVKQFVSPSLLNVGSSTDEFREIIQPHIDKNIFAKLREQGVKITHLDIKVNKGVDIIGDLTDPLFLEKLQNNNYNLVLCSNLLEHVPNPEEICQSLSKCVTSGGYIIVSGPYVYPHHEDPVDTMFRPTPMELFFYFPGCKLITGEILVINDTLFNNLMRNKRNALIFIVRMFTPFYKFKKWKKFIFNGVPFLLKNFKVTCLIVQKDMI